jgi:hypothetical protein
MRYSMNDIFEFGGVWRNISAPDALVALKLTSRVSLQWCHIPKQQYTRGCRRVGGFIEAVFDVNRMSTVPESED